MPFNLPTPSLPGLLRLGLLAGFVFFGTPAVVAARPAKSPVQPATPSHAAKFALLVGISSYGQPDVFPPLPGVLNDIKDMQSVLTGNFNFPASKAYIQVLKDRQATRKNILDALGELNRRVRKAHNAGANPIVLFYFSGHGSYVSDTSRDEERARAQNDDRDETLVPYDATRDWSDRTHFDLIDDEIGLQRHELLKHSANVTFIFDCCHSGTLTRGPGDQHTRFREAPPDQRKYLRCPENVPSDAGLYSEFSACMADERAVERPFAPAKTGGTSLHYGAFTYFLLQAMRDAHRGTKNGEIWQKVAVGLNSSSSVQHPQFAGPPNRLFLGGARQLTAPPVIYRRYGNSILIERGVSGGAVPGGFLRFYGSDGKPLSGIGRIIRAGANHCTAGVLAGLKMPVAGRAELLTPYFGSEPLRVAFPNDAIGNRLREFYRAPNNHFVREAKLGVVPDVTVVRSSWAGAKLPPPLTGQPTLAGPVNYISTGPGAPPLFGYYAPVNAQGNLSTEDESLLRQTLENFAAQRNVRTLTNASVTGSGLRSAVQVRLLLDPKVTANRQDGVSSSNAVQPETFLEAKPAGFALKVGQRFQFQLVNRLDQTVYVTLIWLSGDGGVTVFSDLDDRKVLALTPKGSDGDNTRTVGYQVTAPTGREELRVFVSTRSMNLSSIERDPIKRGGLSETERGELSPFDLLIGQALNTRGPAPSSRVSFDDWSDSTIPLSIEAP